MGELAIRERSRCKQEVGGVAGLELSACGEGESMRKSGKRWKGGGRDQGGLRREEMVVQHWS